MKIKQANIGSKIMIAQQQYNHMRKLNEISQKPATITSNTYQPNYQETKYKRLIHSKSLKMQNFDEINHIRNIKHLIERLNSPKTMRDRLKDPYDFFAYPTLFFRQVTQKKAKSNKNKQNLKSKKTKKQLNRIKSENKLKTIKNLQQKNQKHNGLTFEKVKSQMPFLYFFQEENIQQFADALTKLIFNYSLNKIEDIQFLYQCIQKAMPSTYPEDFRRAVDQMFTQIAQSLGIN